MIRMEYNCEADMRKHREDGLEQGLEKVVLAMTDNGLNDEQIAKPAKLPVEVIRKIG